MASTPDSVSASQQMTGFPAFKLPLFASGQTQWERPKGEAMTQPFVPSASFSGPQEGYFFSMGLKGLGYYKDEPKASKYTEI